MSCDVGKATEGVGGGGSAHSPTLPSLRLRHSSFYSLFNPSVASSTPQLILLIIQPFRHFTYVTACSTTLLLLHLRHLASRSCARPPLESNSRYATDVISINKELLMFPFQFQTYSVFFPITKTKLYRTHLRDTGTEFC